MALAISSSLVASTRDLPHRRTIRMSCISHGEAQVLGVNLTGPTRRPSKPSKLPSVATPVENRGRNVHRRGVSWEDSATATSSVSSSQRDEASVADSQELGLAPGVGASPPTVRRRAAMVASMAFLGVGACACCDAAMGAEDWSYGGPAGAAQWGGTCAIGAQQSPVDVRLDKAQHGESLGELQFDYKSCTPTFKNPGHGTMEVGFPEGVSKLRVKGRELNLVQFHFHTPSEHAFDGLRFPMEAHLVHQDAVTKRYAVVGVMLDAAPDADSNGALAAALRYSPLERGKKLSLPNVLVSAHDLLPPRATKDDRRYVHYMGSLTTPPCTESVEWLLLEKPLRVPTFQVLEFMKFVGGERTLALNARPIQPLGDREIFEGP